MAGIKIPNIKLPKLKISGRTKNIIRYVVMLVALCVFSYSAYELTNAYLGNKRSNEVYKKMHDEFFVPNVNSNKEPETDANGILLNPVYDDDYVFDFDKLKKYYKDAVGWIKLDNGKIDYVVMQAEDNDKYLRRTADMKNATAGSIFVDYRCEGGLDARNPIIYGHDMSSFSERTMFGTLEFFYNDKDYYKEHPYFDIWVGSTHYKYYIYSIFHTSTYGSSVYQFSYGSDEEYINYIQTHKAMSIVDIDVGEITAEDHIATLSTCVDNKEELRLVIQLVRREAIEDAPQADEG